MKILLISLMFCMSIGASSLADFYAKQAHCKANIQVVKMVLTNNGMQAPSSEYIYNTCMNMLSGRPSVNDIVGSL